MKRTPLKRGTSGLKRSPLLRGSSRLRRRTPLRQRSERRAVAEAKLARSVEWRRRKAGGWCEANTPACPPGLHPGVVAHHVRLRSQGGSHDVGNLRWICADSHSWTHHNPAEAAARGLIERGHR